MATKDKPLVSIITVCLNSEKHIEQTIKSVISQTYDNIEYVIVDGGSTDGTVRIIRKYEDKISRWVSRKDKGLFDAMNNGISLSNGDFTCFLNSDDFFYSSKSVEYAVEGMIKGGDFIYGKAYFFSTDQHKIIVHSEVKLKELIFSYICHQSVFCSRKVFDKLGNFNLSYKVAADYEFILKCFKDSNIKKTFIDRVISSARAGGNSGRDCLNSLMEKKKVVKLYFNGMDYARYLIYFLFFDYPLALLMQSNLSETYVYKLIVKYMKFLLAAIGLERYMLRTTWCPCPGNPCVYAF